MPRPDRPPSPVQGVLLAAIPAGTWVLVNPGGLDPFQTPKLWFLAVVAAVVTLWWALEAVRGRAPLPPRYGAAAASAFLLALSMATVQSETIGFGLWGPHARANGAMLYGACTAVFLVAAAVGTARMARSVLRSTVLAGATVALVAVAEWMAGRSPWTVGGSIAATMGNPNFVAGTLAIGGVVAVGLTIDREEHPRWRAAAALSAVIMLIAQIPATSLQGPVALASGLWLLGLAVLLSRRPTRLSAMVASWAAIAALTATTGALGLAGRGPLAAVMAQGTIETRRWYWTAALRMFRDEPLSGVGMSGFGSWFRSYRPEGAIEAFGLTTTADAAHSVPLELLATGGAPLFTAYAAVAVLVAFSAVRGWRGAPANRPLLGVLIAGWAAYHVQSLVSIETPATAAGHWLLAGMIVALGWSDRRGSAGNVRRGVVRAWPLASAVMAVTAVILLSRPLAADVAAGRSLRDAQSGNGREALQSIQAAVGRAPWEAKYRVEQARLFFALKEQRAGYLAARAAVEARPRWLPAVLTAARAAANLDMADDAWRLYRQALEVDPHAPDLRLEVGEFALARGRFDEAVAQLTVGVRALGPRAPAESFFRLAEAAERGGDTHGAVEAYRWLAEVHPDYALEAEQEITRLKGQQ